MSKHTPGPWEIDHPYQGDVTSSKGDICTGHFKGHEFGGVSQTKISVDECQANMRLIAAAPEMYSYLDRMAMGISIDVEDIQSLLNRINNV